MHLRSTTLIALLAVASTTACWDEPPYPGLWTVDIDVADRKEISAFEVMLAGDGAAWWIGGTFDDRLSRIGRIDANGNELWTRDLPADEGLDGLAVSGGDTMVGLVFQRGEGTHSLRGYDDDGKEIWSQPWDDARFGSPDEFVGGEHGLYIGVGDGVVFCAANGEDCDLLAPINSGYAVSDLIPFGDGRLAIEAVSLDGALVVVLDAAGEVLIERSFALFVYDVAAGGDDVYVHHSPGRLTRLDLAGPDTGTFEQPEGLAGIGATADGDLLALTVEYPEDEVSRYSPDFELRSSTPVRSWGTDVAERPDGSYLVWTSEYDFPALWIAAVRGADTR